MRILFTLLIFVSVAVAEEEDKGMEIITWGNDTETGIVLDTTEEDTYLTLGPPPEYPFVLNINGYPWKRCKDGIIGLVCQYWCAKEERWLDAGALCGSLSDN